MARKRAMSQREVSQREVDAIRKVGMTCMSDNLYLQIRLTRGFKLGHYSALTVRQFLDSALTVRQFLAHGERRPPIGPPRRCD